MKIIASKSLPTPDFSLTSLIKLLRLLTKYFKMGMIVAHFLSSSGGIHEKLEKSKTCNWRNKKNLAFHQGFLTYWGVGMTSPEVTLMLQLRCSKLT